MKYWLRGVCILCLLLYMGGFAEAQSQIFSVDQLRELSFEPIDGSDGLEMAIDRSGNKWVRGYIPLSLLGKSIVFQIPSARIHHYKLFIFQEGRLQQLLPNTFESGDYFKARFPQYRFTAQDAIYYIQLQHNLPGILQVSLYERHAFSSVESSQLLRIGLYYGLALMSVVFNVVFYVIFRDKRFITYCVLLFTTFLSFFYEDGMLYYLTDGRWTMDYLIIWNISITAIVSLMFTYYFLGLERVLRSYIKWYILASVVLLSGALVYTLTDYNWVYHLVSILCFCFALVALYLAIRRFRKDIYARFLVLSFSFVVLTAICYVMYTYVSSSSFASFDIGVFRTVSAIEIIAISFAIIFKVKNLQEENERYRMELDTYLRRLAYQSNGLKDDANEHDIMMLGSPVQRTKEQIGASLRKQYELTEREIDVLHAIWDGLTNKEIAEKLFITLSTTKYHVSNLYLKLDVKNRNQVQVLRDSLK